MNIRKAEFDVIIRCANLGTAELVKAEIKHQLGYDAEITDTIEKKCRERCK